MTAANTDTPSHGCPFCLDKHDTEQACTVRPFAVEPGWQRSVFIRSYGTSGYRMLFYADGTARFEHVCDRGDRGVVVCAPALQLGNGHTITSYDPLTITPSILCPDCGTHGFITDGMWVR